MCSVDVSAARYDQDRVRFLVAAGAVVLLGWRVEVFFSRPLTGP